MSRFIDINALKKQIETEGDNSHWGLYGTHCKQCGDTSPKHGFYPLRSYCYLGSDSVETSDVICNRCALSDDAYLETFGEYKEIITQKS